MCDATFVYLQHFDDSNFKLTVWSSNIQIQLIITSNLTALLLYEIESLIRWIVTQTFTSKEINEIDYLIQTVDTRLFFVSNACVFVSFWSINWTHERKYGKHVIMMRRF